jgi:hypothetical protein
MTKKGKPGSLRQRDILKKIRKPMPPPSRVIHPKKKYDRKDFDWRDHVGRERGGRDDA